MRPMTPPYEIEKLAFRGTFALGPGYRWLDRKDFAVLVTRVGPAATYENFYDPKRSELKPEMVAEVETAVEKSGAKSREAWAKHTLLKAAGVKEPLVKRKDFKGQKSEK